MAEEDTFYWCINVPGYAGLNPMTVASSRRGAIARWLEIACKQEPGFLMQLDDEALRRLWRYYREHRDFVGGTPGGRPNLACVVKINVSCVQERTDEWNM